ncbi:MAG: imidazole glycerol phosphate synthase subunit HisF [Acidobacteria bacterium]|nr:MAG: imidazole glycerol phosphate synthase subunit HisF [Acidobacteriota bacterium]
MLRTRVIPCLLLKSRGLVKTVKFKDPTYVGDPINAVRIFNDKEVDELLFLDITASVEGRRPPFNVISEIASECFMPLGYGGGIRSLEDIRTLFFSGVEKACINSYAVENPAFVKSASDTFGSSSIVVSIDVKRNLFGKNVVYTDSGRRNTGLDPIEYAKQVEEMGAGEIFLNSIDRDGTMRGYDIELVRKLSDAVTIPVVACGGAGKLKDIYEVLDKGGASGAAAGSLFVFHGRHRAVLISYPSKQELEGTSQQPVGSLGPQLN